MDTTCNKRKKAKLPRKRKKALKKHDSLIGKNSYINTIKLFAVTDEEYCKFWKETAIAMNPNGFVEIVPVSYW